MTLNRWTAIHTGAPHYLDHLGILCMELDLPLYVTEPATFEAAKKFYPALQCKLVSPEELSLEYLAKNYDALFESGHLWALELQPLFKLLHQKRMRIVYCPHGNSDKGYSQRSVPKDISLVYGSHMIEHLERTESSFNGIVLTGNYRYSHYQKNRKFYDGLLTHRLRTLDHSKKTIFYAPTWPDGENRSSFLDYASRVIEEVGEYYNVMIRWHPFLDELHPVEVEQLLGKYETRKGILFLNDIPCIYPLLNQADGYLGDFSSIGYDFLAFNRPLFFLDSHFGQLYTCGVKLDLNAHLGKAIAATVDTPQLEKRRQDLYRNVFGEKKEGSEILNDLKRALSCDRAPEC